MQIGDLIIGLMAAIVFLVVPMNLVSDMYTSHNLDVDLSQYEETARLVSFSDNLSDSKDDLNVINRNLQSNIPGGEVVDYSTGVITEGDLAKASLSAISNIPRYLTIFVSTVSGMLSTLGISGIYSWFFTTALLVVVIFILLSSVLRNKI